MRLVISDLHLSFCSLRIALALLVFEICDLQSEISLCLLPSYLISALCYTALVGHGEVSEWLKEHAWKACLGETPTWVRIPPSPPAYPLVAQSHIRVGFVVYLKCPLRFGNGAVIVEVLGSCRRMGDASFQQAGEPSRLNSGSTRTTVDQDFALVSIHEGMHLWRGPHAAQEVLEERV